MKEKILNFVKSKLRKKKFWLVFVIIIIGIFIYRYFSNRGKDQIVTTEIKRGDVKEELVLTGSVKAEEYVQLTFPTSGQITWVGVKE